MKRKVITKGALLILVGIASAVLVFPTAYAPAAEKKVEWRVVAGPEGSFGYVCATAWTKFLRDRIKNFALYPEAGPTVKAFRKLAEGNLMATYGNTVLAEQAYTNTGIFEKAPLKGLKPQHALPIVPFTYFMVVDKKSNMHTMDDLVGRNASITTPAHGIFPPAMYVMQTLGLWGKFNQKDMALADLASAMTAGIVESVMMFVSSGVTTAGALREVEARIDMRPLTFTEEQKKKIQALPGIDFTEAKNVFKEVKQDKIPGWTYYYGWYFSPKADPKIVYQIVKTTYEGRKELVKADIGFTPWSERPKELLKAAFARTPNVPIHAGAAKFYKEIGVIK
jgi:TRAP transporter TAXI family solute receptor